MTDHKNETGVTGKYTKNGTPVGYTAITPFIIVSDPAKAIDFYEKVFGAKAKNVTAMNNDGQATIVHAELDFGNGYLQLGAPTQAFQTVLPPGYLCCGYPQRGNGMEDKAQKIITENRVLFHRMANTLNYLDIKTVVVSCGTCYDQLAGYEFDKIFPGCRLIDIHEYLLEKGIKLDGVTGARYMYHDPCHTPMKLQDPMKTVRALVGEGVDKSDRCCGESGTLAVTRPDISTQVRFRKEEELRKGADKLRADGYNGQVKVLTSCPSCLQGLSRYNDDANLDADYIVVEIARNVLGQQWMEDYVRRANEGGIERVLL